MKRHEEQIIDRTKPGKSNAAEEMTTADSSVSEKALATEKEQTDSAPVRRSNRHPKVPGYLKDRVTGTGVRE